MWILLALVLLCAGGAGAYALFTAEEEESKDDGLFDPSAWENDDTGLSGDESTSDTSEDEDEDEGIAIETYTDPAFNYRVHLPENFEHQNDRNGMGTFSGSVSGHNVQVLTLAWSTHTTSETDLENEVSRRLAANSVVIESMRWKDSQTLVGNVKAPDDELSGEFIASKQRGVLFVVAIGSPATSAKATKKFRRKFLRDGYQLSF